MNPKLRVGVIFGGQSGEHEVSLVSASSVIEALDKEKYDVVPIGITKEGRWISSPGALLALKERTGIDDEPGQHLVPEPGRRGSGAENSILNERLDVVFPIVHGTFGEDGALQGLLELSGIPYVGAGVLGSALGMDKIIQKQLFHEAGLPIVRYVWMLASAFASEPKKSAGRIERALGYPLFVKPANTGSSVGITKAHNRKELEAGFALASRFDRRIIFEEGIANVREIECSVLGNDDPIASLPGEIIPCNEFYDYNAKYVDEASQSVIPANLRVAMVKVIRTLAVRAFTTLDCAGMARVDFFVTKRNKLYLNEINTIPGFTSISMYPKMWEASGVPYAAVLDRLIDLAVDRHQKMSLLQRTYTPSKEWYAK